MVAVREGLIVYCDYREGGREEGSEGGRKGVREGRGEILGGK